MTENEKIQLLRSISKKFWPFKEDEYLGMLWIRTKNMEDAKKIRFYARKIILRLCAKEQRMLYFDEFFDTVDYKNEDNDLDNLLNKSSAGEKIDQALKDARISPKEFGVIYEIFWNKKTLTQVAEEEGITKQAIHQRLNKIIARLKEAMQ